MQQLIGSSAELAEIFNISERQVERLGSGGILEKNGTATAYRIELETVVPPYAVFLVSDISLSDGAPGALTEAGDHSPAFFPAAGLMPRRREVWSRSA